MDHNILQQHNIRIQAFDIKKACTSNGENSTQITNEMQSTFYMFSQFLWSYTCTLFCLLKEYAYLLHIIPICMDCTCAMCVYTTIAA